MQLTKYTAFFATAVVGLTTAHVNAQGTWFGGESDIEVDSWAREGSYFSISGLVVSPDDANLSGTTDAELSFDPGAGFSLAYGYEFAGRFRGEVQYSYMELSLDSVDSAGVSADAGGSATAQTVMVNAYYDFPFTVQIEPYLGVGIGGAHHTADLSGLGRESDLTLAAQAMAGVGYKINSRTTLSTGIRYVVSDDPSLGDAYDEFTAFVFEFGIRIGF